MALLSWELLLAGIGEDLVGNVNSKMFPLGPWYRPLPSLQGSEL